MKTIVLVDDDPKMNERLCRLLKPLESEWKMVSVGSGQEALTTLAAQRCDVIMTDMRMPGKDGVQLLEEVRTGYPHVVRVLLTEPSDQEAVLRSAGSAHQCLPKSSALKMFQSTITRACAIQDLLSKAVLLKLVSGMHTLPSLPTLYREVMQELQSPDASIDKIGQIISKDPGMLTKMLQVVNSPFYGLPRRISSATQAVALLGLETIKSLVLSMKVFSQFESSAQTFFSLDILWNHGMITGRYARMIAKEQGADARNMEEDAFTAGLLHDVGLLVLATNAPDQYTETLALMNQGIAEWEAERQVLGATHAEVGGYLLGTWGLSDTIVEAVAFHHDPGRSTGHTFSPLAAVHIANVLEEQAAGMDGPSTMTDMDYLRACGLDPDMSKWETLCRGEPKRDGGR
ncbi:MAG TPA: response regulator [Nitrospiraceae bacterium]|nr:response regulator [Nitrospiraceae bacterium]